MWRKNLAVSLCILAITGNGERGFVGTNGTRFVVDEKAFYLNGFNAYWLMYMGSDPSTRDKVSDTYVQASKYGMNVARTWAFSDGGDSRPLQISPGVYNYNTFKGLDFVVSEASKHGIRLILSLVNNWKAFGGKKQYIVWAVQRGQNLKNDDDFFTNPTVKDYYKNHIKKVLTRVNSFSGVAYKDDPTILAWELMNEPRTPSDLSGKSIQDWVNEMSTYVKSIDNKHLLEIGIEGFYGSSNKQNNPGYQVGTDFIANNVLPHVDFATIHLYPDQWLNASETTFIQDSETIFVKKWMKDHIKDSVRILKKPLMLTEFGKSSNSSGYTVGARNKYFMTIYNRIYKCARSGGPCGGALFWQVMGNRMESWADGYQVVLDQHPSTVDIIYHQSKKMTSLNKLL